MRLLTCEIAEEFRVSSDLCQMAASYWILGPMIVVYSLLIYLKGVLHVILAMLDNARANFVSFFVAYAKWAWNLSF